MPLFDEPLLAKLPTNCRAKIVRLDIERDAAYAALTAAIDNMREVRADLSRAEVGLRREAEGQVHTGFSLKRRASADEIFETISHRLEPLKTRLLFAEEAHKKALTNFTQFAFLEACRDWLTNWGAEILPYLPASTSKVGRSSSAGDDLSKIRKKIEEIDAELSTVFAAPLPKDELIKRATDEIDAVAKRGEVSIRLGTRTHTPLRYADRIAVSTTERGEIIGDTGSFFTWLLRDAIVATIAAEIEAMPIKDALTDDIRDKKMRELGAAKLELERAEEAAILTAEQSGHALPRRQDADPRAVFEVSA